MQRQSFRLSKYQSITGQTGLAYDVDGNITQDGTWYYRYDGDNRLREMERKSGGKTVQYKYDYMGRMVRRTVRSGGPTATITGSTKYVWNGWKLIAELDAGTSESGSTWVRGYVWGMDYSNASGAAGGAGGLVAVNTSTADYLPVYDSMGNITGYLDASNGSVAAGCEYNAFGQIVASTGSWSSFAFGFASQFTDRDTGLVYYGKRFYDPWQGRFINRDPIEEAGGLNLYNHTGNSPTNRWDVLGLNWLRFHFEGGGGFGDAFDRAMLSMQISLLRMDGAREYRLYRQDNPHRPLAPVPVAILDAILSMTKAGAFDGEGFVPSRLIFLSAYDTPFGDGRRPLPSGLPVETYGVPDWVVGAVLRLTEDCAKTGNYRLRYQKRSTIERMLDDSIGGGVRRGNWYCDCEYLCENPLGKRIRRYKQAAKQDLVEPVDSGTKDAAIGLAVDILMPGGSDPISDAVLSKGGEDLLDAAVGDEPESWIVEHSLAVHNKKIYNFMRRCARKCSKNGIWN